MVALGVGCGAAPLKTESSTRAPDDPRVPDGVVLELEPALPEPEATPKAEDTVVLVPGVSSEAADELLHKFFDAVFAEDIQALGGTLMLKPPNPGDDDAGLVLGRERVLSVWRTRMARLEYDKLREADVLDADAFSFYRTGTLDGPDAPRIPSTFDDGDLMVRVWVKGDVIDGERYFGQEIVFWLKGRGDECEIAGVAEEGAP